MKKRERAVVSSLLRQIDEGYDRRSWHGANLRGSLRGLSPAQAAWRPGPGRHNIWELAVHAAYWKYTVRRRLDGAPRGAFAIKGSNWFVRPDAATLRAWRADLALLATEHRLLRASVARLADRDLARSAGKATVGFLLRGIAAHDLYHAGQIQLLRRLSPR